MEFSKGDDLFKDRKQRLIGIPLVALLLTIIFIADEGSTVSFPLGFLIGLIYTVTIWEANRKIFIICNEYYPRVEQTFRRIVVQTVATITVTTLIASFMLLVEVYVLHTCSFDGESWIEKVNHSLIPTGIITIIYEARAYFIRWRNAMQETEQLKRENLSIQLQGLKNQISPHFLFNSLNTLATIIPEDPVQSVEFVQKLSNTYRYLLEQRDKNLVDLSTELAFIDSYFFLQKIRFGDNLQLEIEVSDQHKYLKLPPLSMQLLLENAIKHNIISDTKPLKIKIKSLDDKQLMVSNNLQPRLMVEPSTGIGLKNIQSRYQHLGVNGLKINRNDQEFTVTIPLLS